jgi:hypothetical protein
MFKMKLHPQNYLIILCPNHLPFKDLSDVVMSREKIIIGVKNRQSLHLYQDLVKAFPKLALFTEARLIDPELAVQGYGVTYHLYLAADFQPTPPDSPDPVLFAMTVKYPSHLLPFYPINSGDYFAKTNEKRFYAANKKYHKALLENKVIQLTYPYLTVDKMLYMPTISL